MSRTAALFDRRQPPRLLAGDPLKNVPPPRSGRPTRRAVRATRRWNAELHKGCHCRRRDSAPHPRPIRFPIGGTITIDRRILKTNSANRSSSSIQVRHRTDSSRVVIWRLRTSVLPWEIRRRVCLRGCTLRWPQRDIENRSTTRISVTNQRRRGRESRGFLPLRVHRRCHGLRHRAASSR